MPLLNELLKDTGTELLGICYTSLSHTQGAVSYWITCIEDMGGTILQKALTAT